MFQVDERGVAEGKTAVIHQFSAPGDVQSTVHGDITRKDSMIKHLQRTGDGDAAVVHDSTVDLQRIAGGNGDSTGA